MRLRWLLECNRNSSADEPNTVSYIFCRWNRKPLVEREQWLGSVQRTRKRRPFLRPLWANTCSTSGPPPGRCPAIHETSDQMSVRGTKRAMTRCGPSSVRTYPASSYLCTCHQILRDHARAPCSCVVRSKYNFMKFEGVASFDLKNQDCGGRNLVQVNFNGADLASFQNCPISVDSSPGR